MSKVFKPVLEFQISYISETEISSIHILCPLCKKQMISFDPYDFCDDYNLEEEECLVLLNNLFHQYSFQFVEGDEDLICSHYSRIEKDLS